MAHVAILVAILGHKFVEGLSLASSFVKEGVTLRTSLSVLLGYSLMTPLGMFAGLRLVHGFGPTATLVESLVSGFAAGSFSHGPLDRQLCARTFRWATFRGEGSVGSFSRGHFGEQFFRGDISAGRFSHGPFDRQLFVGNAGWAAFRGELRGG